MKMNYHSLSHEAVGWGFDTLLSYTVGSDWRAELEHVSDDQRGTSPSTDSE